jgi:L-lactate utilization protein LutB
MEYYAHWCGHCQKFAPTYEQVGNHFMDMSPPPVIIARIDCAKHVRHPHYDCHVYVCGLHIALFTAPQASSCVPVLVCNVPG